MTESKDRKSPAELTANTWPGPTTGAAVMLPWNSVDHINVVSEPYAYSSLSGAPKKMVPSGHTARSRQEHDTAPDFFGPQGACAPGRGKHTERERERERKRERKREREQQTRTVSESDGAASSVVWVVPGFDTPQLDAGFGVVGHQLRTVRVHDSAVTCHEQRVTVSKHSAAAGKERPPVKHTAKHVCGARSDVGKFGFAFNLLQELDAASASARQHNKRMAHIKTTRTKRTGHGCSCCTQLDVFLRC